MDKVGDYHHRLDGELLYRPVCVVFAVTTMVAVYVSASFDKLLMVWSLVAILFMAASGRLSPSAGTLWWPSSSSRANRSSSAASPSSSSSSSSRSGSVTMIRTMIVVLMVGILIWRILVDDPCPIKSCPVPLPCPVPMACPSCPSCSKELVPLGSSPARGEASHRKLAIVFPFIASHAERLFKGIEGWREFLPCRVVDGHIASGATISLVMYYDRDVDTAPLMRDGRTMKQYFADSWETLPEQTRSCVTGGIELLGAKIPDELNVHPDGPCIQQFRLHELLLGRYDHFFQMEPDVAPIQDYWMDEIVKESNDNEGCDRFWMKGSASRCDGRFGQIAKRRDYHINGNALYCLGNAQFTDFINRIYAAYPPGHVTHRLSPGCGTGKWAEDGWDHTFFQYRLQAENFDYAKHINWKFIDAPFFSNLCEDEYNPQEVLEQSSYRTFLAHSKFPFLSGDDQWLRRTFIAVMGRYSSPQDRHQYLPPKPKKIPGTDKYEEPIPMDYQGVVDKLCAHSERRSYLSSLSNEAVLVANGNGDGADTAQAQPSPRAVATAVCSEQGRAALLANAHEPPMKPPTRADVKPRPTRTTSTTTSTSPSSVTVDDTNDNTDNDNDGTNPTVRRRQRLTRQRPAAAVDTTDNNISAQQ